MSNKLLNILREFESPKERMKKVLRTLVKINDGYQKSLILIDNHFRLIYNTKAYQPLDCKTGGSIIKMPEENMVYQDLYLKKWEEMARDYLFVMNIIPYFNKGLDEKERKILIEKYLKKLGKPSPIRRLRAREKKLLNVAEEKLIELLYCDYYGYQEKDMPGSILWKATINKRRTERTGISDGYLGM